MFARIKEISVGGSPSGGQIEAEGVAVYWCNVPTRGRYRFSLSAKVVLILELGDDPGNILERERGRDCEIIATLDPGTYYLAISGATKRTEGKFTLVAAVA